MARLTAEELRQIVHYDPETGVFTRTVDRHGGRWKAGSIVGGLKGHGYMHATIAGEKWLLHRLAWFWMTGETPKGKVDHWNTIKSDNRWSNLRLATMSQNGANRGKSIKSTTGIKGVSKCRATGRWRASITVRGKSLNLGRYMTKDEAAGAYARAAEMYFGEFARV